MGGQYGASLSASSSLSEGFENNSSITNNATNYAIYVVIGLVVILGGVWLLRR